MLTPKEKRLLRQANQLERDNKLSASEVVYHELVTESPAIIDGWLGIARVADNESVKKDALRRIIEIAPDHDLAQSALAGDPLPPLAPLEVKESKPVVSPGQVQETYGLPDERVAYEGETEQPVGLRCNKCGKLIEPKDVVPSPVGYRCKECARKIEAKYFTSKPLDYVISTLVALPISLLAGYFAPLLGFFIIFVGAGIGTLIGTAAFRSIGRRRGRYLPYVVAACVVIGAGVWMLLFGQLLWRAVYAFIAASAAFYRMK